MRSSLAKGIHLFQNIGMLCVQEFLFCWVGGLLETLSDVYILTKGEKNINVGKNENVELPHSQVFYGRLCVFCE